MHRPDQSRTSPKWGGSEHLASAKAWLKSDTVCLCVCACARMCVCVCVCVRASFSACVGMCMFVYWSVHLCDLKFMFVKIALIFILKVEILVSVLVYNLSRFKSLLKRWKKMCPLVNKPVPFQTLSWCVCTYVFGALLFYVCVDFLFSTLCT